MPTASTGSSSGHASTRQRILAMHLDRARTFCELYAESDSGAVRIEMGEQSLTLDPWVRECILSPAENSRPGDLLAQGVALLMKIASDFDVFRDAQDVSREEIYAIQAELMLDTAIGAALVRECQQAVEDAVRRGEMDHARVLTSFQHELRRGIAAVKKEIAESEHESIENLSDSLTDQPRDEAVADDSMNRLARQLGDQVELDELQKRKRSLLLKTARRIPLRTDVLIGALGFVLAVWFGTIMLPKAVNDVAQRPLTLAELQCEAIVGAVARAPSLFVQLDEKVWNSFTDGERKELIERASVVLLTNGYTGALFRLEDNRPVARWLVNRGSELVETTEHRTVPAESLPPVLRFAASRTESDRQESPDRKR